MSKQSVKTFSTKEIFTIVKKKSKKQVVNQCVVWFYPYEKTIVHASIRKKIGNAVVRNRIRRILKNTMIKSSVKRGIYIFYPYKFINYKQFVSISNYFVNL